MTELVGRVIHSGAARFHMKSCNRKLSPVELVDIGGRRKRLEPRGPFCCSTYVSIAATCSSACPFKGNGCYVQAGFTGRAVRQLDGNVRGRSGFEVTLDEVAAIDDSFSRGPIPQDGARGGRDLRLHDSGDAPGKGAAMLLGEAAARWRRRGGGSVWTYTHAWKHVPREVWGTSINVLASVERPEQIAEVVSRGYAPALVVDRHRDARAYELAGVKMIPCPAETRGRTCVDCRLCVDQDLHKLGAGIAFAVHGQQAAKAAAALVPLKTRRVAA
jgi:hypothetical protein